MMNYHYLLEVNSSKDTGRNDKQSLQQEVVHKVCNSLLRVGSRMELKTYYDKYRSNFSWTINWLRKHSSDTYLKVIDLICTREYLFSPNEYVLRISKINEDFCFRNVRELYPMYKYHYILGTDDTDTFPLTIDCNWMTVSSKRNLVTYITTQAQDYAEENNFIFVNENSDNYSSITLKMCHGISELLAIMNILSIYSRIELVAQLIVGFYLKVHFQQNMNNYDVVESLIPYINVLTFKNACMCLGYHDIISLMGASRYLRFHILRYFYNSWVAKIKETPIISLTYISLSSNNLDIVCHYRAKNIFIIKNLMPAAREIILTKAKVKKSVIPFSDMGIPSCFLSYESYGDNSSWFDPCYGISSIKSRIVSHSRYLIHSGKIHDPQSMFGVCRLLGFRSSYKRPNIVSNKVEEFN